MFNGHNIGGFYTEDIHIYKSMKSGWTEAISISQIDS